MKALLCNNIFNDVILKYHEKDDIGFVEEKISSRRDQSSVKIENNWIAQ